MKLRADSFILEWRPNPNKSERNLRCNLNLERWDAVLFNVYATKNKSGTEKEFDAIMWNDTEKAILFVEYKDSPKTYRNYKGKTAQQKKSYAKNIANAFGFQWYNFVVVVNKKEQSSKKGDAAVILKDELKKYLLIKKEDENIVFKNDGNEIEFIQTNDELNSIDKIINRYKNKKSAIEVSEVLEDMGKIRKQIEQVNKNR